MSEQTDTIAKQLTTFGLTEEEAKIYLFLAQNGTLSALKISREVHLARTRVYRILDKLTAKQLVSIKLDDAGQKFEANSYKELELLVKEKEAEVEKLRGELPLISEQLAKIWSTGQAKSKVLYYTGVDGLAQITWNSTKSKDGIRIYEIEQDMNAFLEPDFSEKVRQELADNNVFTYQLSNKKRIDPYTKVKKLVKELWEVRHIDPRELAMRFECLIYNDVFCLYNFQGSDQFCVEIYNEKLATMQKQVFDFVWQKAKKMKIVNDSGEATLV